jgi:hypothetical protein
MLPNTVSQPATVAGVVIPRGAMVRAAADTVRAALPEVLVSHAARVFVFAALAGRRRRIDLDAEILYVSSMFLDVGLSAAYSHSQLRYEVRTQRGGLLENHGIWGAQAEHVWHAVALHTTPGIPEHMSPLAALIASAVRTDLFAHDITSYSRTQQDEILRVFPRGPGFKEGIIHAIGNGIAHPPASTFDTLSAGVYERIDPGYQRVNFCGLILGAAWPDLPVA